MQIATLSPEHSAYRPRMQCAYPAGMTNGSPRQVRRRENLRKLIGEEPGAQAQLAQGIGTPKSHLSAILAGRRGVGDALAQKIESHFGLPVGMLDSDPATDGYPPDVADVAAQISALPDKQRDWVLRTVRDAIEFARETITNGLGNQPSDVEQNQPTARVGRR
jgi:transcriptional regulator with XRE-family HTH domain